MKLEINMVVKDAKAAGEFYSKLFDAKIISETDVKLGMNEVIMKIANTQVRVLDENIEYGLVAPAKEVIPSLSINIFVDDIYATIKLAEELGCAIISPITKFEHAINAVLSDVFGHLWIINQDISITE